MIKRLGKTLYVNIRIRYKMLGANLPGSAAALKIKFRVCLSGNYLVGFKKRYG